MIVVQSQLASRVFGIAFAVALISSIAFTVQAQESTRQLGDTPSMRAEPGSILLFTRTTGFRHGSIPDAIDAIRTIAQQNGFTVDDTEDASVFSQAGLAPYQAVVFLMTTGNVLNDTQQSAFEDYIRAGNGFAGVHSATDTEYDWPWYGDLVGAYFSNHPNIQDAQINIEDADHPSTADLPAVWSRRDEWYNFQTNPRGLVNVLATIDESSYSGGNMGDDHPIAWFHDYDGGRSWYTAGGHTNESYSEEDFLAHILGGLLYVTTGTAAADSDGDGVLDGADNCLAVNNPSQQDSDADAIGNRCDGDFNNDCEQNFEDLAIMKADFFGSGDLQTDMNGDNNVDFLDLNQLKAVFFDAPGPSGLANNCE